MKTIFNTHTVFHGKPSTYDPACCPKCEKPGEKHPHFNMCRGCAKKHLTRAVAVRRRLKQRGTLQDSISEKIRRIDR